MEYNEYKVMIITEDDLERYKTLENSDIGRKYVLINNTIQFVPDNLIIGSYVTFE